MKDALENFISQNRNAFDDKQPSDKAWNNIEKTLPMRKNLLWNSVALWRAAAVIFMALSFYLMLPKNTDEAKGHDVAMTEFKDVEAFYIQQISERVELIDTFRESEGLNGFTHDFKQLEAMYAVLKEEIKAHPSDKVRDALVLNLLVRIDLLNQQLHRLEKDYPKEGKKDGRNT